MYLYLIDYGKGTILHILLLVLEDIHVNILINELILIHLLVLVKVCTCSKTQEVQVHNNNF
jgi:hypothetical protein